MPIQKVVIVTEYEAPTPEDAEREMRENLARYETRHLVAAASSYEELPHPLQLVPDDER